MTETYVKAEQFDLPIGALDSAPKEYKRASLLNKTEVKRRLLQYAADTRAHPFRRVSGLTLECLEARVENMIRTVVKEAPSRGVTL